MQTAAQLIDGKQVKARLLTEFLTITANQTAKADKYEYKGDC